MAVCVCGPNPSSLYVATVKVYVVKLASPMTTRVTLMEARGTRMGVVTEGGGAGTTLMLYPM